MNFVRVWKGDLGPTTTVNGGGIKKCVLTKKTWGYITDEWIDKGFIYCMYTNSLLIILEKCLIPHRGRTETKLTHTHTYTHTQMEQP